MNRFIKVYLIVLVLITLSLLVINTISIKNLKVDDISIFLLIIMILIPFITAIKKFKWGDFEAEIGEDEVNKVKKTVDKAVSTKNINNALRSKTIEGYTQKELDDLIDYLIELAAIDPVLAMAKLRLELEKLIRGIYIYHGGNAKYKNSITYMIKYLSQNEDFKYDEDELKSASLMISISNRVIHGEKIEKQEAKSIIYSAVKLLGYMTGYNKVLDENGILKN